MDRIRIGEINTTSIGLGCGGLSRLGMGRGSKMFDKAVSLVKSAYDLGIRFFDTAESYTTEPALGEGLAGKNRSELTLCSKLTIRNGKGEYKSPDEIRRSLEQSLKNLGTDYLDIYYAHAVLPGDYDRVNDYLLPLFRDFQKEGLIRKAGLSEFFSRDTNHRMLGRAVDEGLWDGVMAGFNFINQSARELMVRAGEKGLFRVNMFAVRQAMINNEVFGIYMDKMIGEGKYRFTYSEFYKFKDSLFRGADSVSFPGLAYRFVRDENLFDVILTGTGNREHLKDNLDALEEKPLSDRIRGLVRDFFEGECETSGQEGFFLE